MLEPLLMHGGMVGGGRESCCAMEAAGVYKFIFQVTSLPVIMGNSFYAVRFVSN
jgi:hypothetical protein